jgi:hypothetical protein
MIRGDVALAYHLASRGARWRLPAVEGDHRGATNATDARFLSSVADRLESLPGVRAVTLGGSRAQGTHRPTSDWDIAIYYRDSFDPSTLRDIGWPGQVFEIGAWGGGVFNGGAWLHIDGRKVDILYRDLDVVDHEIGESFEGRFRIEPLMFHLAGIPSYLVVGELATNRVLRGELPRPDYPVLLRENAPAVWLGNAELTFGYAKVGHAPYGRLAQCAGLIAQAASQAAHAVLSARGDWVTNEKTLLTRAGLRGVDGIVADAWSEPESLVEAVQRAQVMCLERVRDAMTRWQSEPSTTRPGGDAVS